MTKIVCESDICMFNVENVCQKDRIELVGNKLDPSCQSIEWNDQDVKIYIDD